MEPVPLGDFRNRKSPIPHTFGSLVKTHVVALEVPQEGRTSE